MTFVISLLCFTPGMALMVFVLNPLLEAGFAQTNMTLDTLVGLDAGWLIGTGVLLALLWLVCILPRKK